MAASGLSGVMDLLKSPDAPIPTKPSPLPHVGPLVVNDLHNHDDVDQGILSHHHTLGFGPGQAMPGNAKTGSPAFLECLVYPGPIGTATDLFPAGLHVPFNMNIKKANLRCNRNKPPVGSDLVINIYSLLAGVNIYSISIPAGQTNTEASASFSLTAGDRLYLGCTSAGSTTPAWDVGLQLIAG